MQWIQRESFSSTETQGGEEDGWEDEAFQTLSLSKETFMTRLACMSPESLRRARLEIQTPQEMCEASCSPAKGYRTA
jgi:hypothetical protein